MEVITVTKTISVRAFIISPNKAHVVVTESIDVQHRRGLTIRNNYFSFEHSPSLTLEEIKEFQKITMELFGRELTDEEALDQGTRLAQAGELLVDYFRTKLPIETKANRLEN